MTSFDHSTSDRPAVRASDGERETVATRLRDAAAAGRLSLEEADERMAAAYAAVTRDDLAPLTADLPGPPRAEHRSDRRPRGPLTPGARRGLAVHAAVVFVLAVFLVTRWAIGPVEWFWPAGPLFWLTLSLLVHGLLARREHPAHAVGLPQPS
jgi:DUF1707 SHOCT-like domain